jgi:hypothetical protein
MDSLQSFVQNQVDAFSSASNLSAVNVVSPIAIETEFEEDADSGEPVFDREPSVVEAPPPMDPVEQEE